MADREKQPTRNFAPIKTQVEMQQVFDNVPNQGFLDDMVAMLRRSGGPIGDTVSGIWEAGKGMISWLDDVTFDLDNSLSDSQKDAVTKAGDYKPAYLAHLRETVSDNAAKRGTGKIAVTKDNLPRMFPSIGNGQPETLSMPETVTTTGETVQTIPVETRPLPSEDEQFDQLLNDLTKPETPLPMPQAETPQGNNTALLSLIAGKESTAAFKQQNVSNPNIFKSEYDVQYGGFKQAPPKPLTEMTVNEVLAYQDAEAARGAVSTAAGRYQIIRGTMRDVVKRLGLTGDEKFDQKLQDRMAEDLLKVRGLDKFQAGKISLEKFAENLAKEWASFPVLADTTRDGIPIKRGQSFYQGKAGNRAGYSVDQVTQALTDLSKPQVASVKSAAEQAAPQMQKAAESALVSGKSVIQAASEYLGINENNPEHQQTISAFFAKAVPDVDIVTDPNQVTRPDYAWCAAFVNHVLSGVGINTNLTGFDPIYARKYAEIGQPVSDYSQAQPGDLVVKTPDSKGRSHVGFFVGLSPNGKLRVLGGNQNNEVNVTEYDPKDFPTIRRVTSIAEEDGKVLNDLSKDIQKSGSTT